MPSRTGSDDRGLSFPGRLRMSRCEQCRFFKIVMSQGPTPGDRLIGHCHRLPPRKGKPTPLRDDVGRAEISHFPLVKASDWCGEFQATTSRIERVSGLASKEQPSHDMRLVVSTREAARMLDISERHLHTLSNKGAIPKVKIGSRVCYRIESLRAWLTAHESPSDSRDTCH